MEGYEDLKFSSEDLSIFLCRTILRFFFSSILLVVQNLHYSWIISFSWMNRIAIDEIAKISNN